MGTHLSGQLLHIDAHLDIEKETIDLQNYVNYNYIIYKKKNYINLVLVSETNEFEIVC
jgi:hypothetical protein